MKKVICLLFAIQLLIISICGLNTFKDKKMNDMLYKNTTSITLNFDSPKKYSNEFGKYIQELGKKKNVSISKYIFQDDNNITIYTSDPSLNKEISLSKGIFPKKKSDEFISNVDTKNSKQSGIFPQIDPKIKFTIKNIDKTNNFGANGIYYISTKNQGTLNDILMDLTKNVASAKIFAVDSSSNITADLAELPTIALVSLCLLLAIIQYSIERLKEVSILRINGFSLIKILGVMVKKMIKILVLSVIIAYIIFSIYYISTNAFNYFILLSIYFGILSIVCVLIATCVLFCVVLIHLKKSNNLNVIKGKRIYSIVSFLQYGLKIIFIIFLLFTIHQSLVMTNVLNEKSMSLSSWNKAKNIYTIQVQYNGENEDKKHFETSNKMISFYKKMIAKKKAFVVNASNYSTMDENYMYDLNSNGVSPEISANGKNITISENYLESNPIDAVKSSVLRQISHDDNVLNILVPKRLQPHEKEIRKNYLDNFYDQKVTVDNFYNDSLKLDKNKIKESDLKINIIYVKNNQKYFTYDSEIELNQKNIIKDPIAIVYTANISSSYCLKYMTTSFYFYSNDEDTYGQILPIISECNLQSSIETVVSV